MPPYPSNLGLGPALTPEHLLYGDLGLDAQTSRLARRSNAAQDIASPNAQLADLYRDNPLPGPVDGNARHLAIPPRRTLPSGPSSPPQVAQAQVAAVPTPEVSAAVPIPDISAVQPTSPIQQGILDRVQRGADSYKDRGTTGFTGSDFDKRADLMRTPEGLQKLLEEQQTAGSFNNGGIVYASEGQLINYQSRGTDTVPAMLTPGEFVVNAKSTGQNLSLLQSINNGTKGYSKGGIIYLAGGGKIEQEGLDLMTTHLGGGVIPPYDPDTMQTIKDERKAREARGEKRETTRKKKMTKDADGKPIQEVDANGKPVYENETKNVKTDEQAKKDREKAKKDAHAAYYEAAKVKEREELLALYKTNEPLQKQAMNEAAAFRITFLAAKNKFINQMEAKVRAGAKETGVSLPEFLENNPQAKAEYDFIRGKIDIDNLGDAQDLMDELNALMQKFPAALVSDPPKYIRDFNLQNTDQAPGRYAYYKAIGAKETYQAQAEQTPDAGNYVLPQDYSFRSEKGQDEIRGPGYVAPEALSSGGVVYASTGKLINFEPKGTDTIPAMLTPGEFVINRSATQANLPLLQSINNGTKTLSHGGMVYLASGGKAKKPSSQEQALAKNPMGELILTIKSQADNSPKTFDAIDNTAINEGLTAEALKTTYEAAWTKLDDETKYKTAKTQYNIDKKRIDYLTSIYNNSLQAYSALKGNSAAKNMRIGKLNILQLLEGQKGAITEANAIHEAWVALAAQNPAFMSGGSTTAQTAAGTATPAKADAKAEKPPEAGTPEVPEEATPKRSGGMIYANQGMMIPYQSRGTDTVPAMLTPGEFVVNRSSAQVNLPLLRSINSSNYSLGGSVRYLTAGGEVDHAGRGGGGSSGVSSGGGSSGPNMEGLSQFTSKFEALIAQLQTIHIPTEITMTGNHKVEVVINGASALSELETGFKTLVTTQINVALEDYSERMRTQTEGGLR